MKKQIDYKELMKRINTRRDELARASQNLKKKFVGLDKIIDSVIENMNVWYIMPELITRPVIINLWGMTGVGKTDLIRSLVKELKYGDRFLEIQLTNKGDFFHTTIKQFLSNSSIEYDSPGLLLLDEVQRFRTKDSQGQEIHDCKFQDLWMLLSDGCFANNANSKEGLLELLFSDVYYNQVSKEDEEMDDPEDRVSAKKYAALKKKRKYHQSYYSANSIKKKLKLTEPVNEIMKWSDEKKFNKVWSALQGDDFFEGDSYKKLLIFISGNLDEAYDMAEHTGDVDNDADVFHEFSSKINIVDIKEALNRRFKPEQISRFGNVHIIYPSLARKSYQEIIRRKVQEIVKDVRKNHGMKIKVDKSVRECIYRNGVFPAQGVRPVFSSVSALLGNSIPTFIVKAIERNRDEIFLTYENDNIVATIGKSKYKYEIECSIDKIKQEDNLDEKILTSVHESGHAVVYAALFGISPTQIVSSTASSDNAGFIGLHSIINSQKDVHNKIAVMMSGKVAEEFVFGEEHSTAGASGDLTKATSMAADYCREWGMGETNAKTTNPHLDHCGHGNYDIAKANDAIEKLVTDCKVRAREIIQENLEFFETSVDLLIKDGEIKPPVFKKIAAKHGLEIKVVPPKESVLSRYSIKLADFKKNGLSKRKAQSVGYSNQRPKMSLAATKKKKDND